MVIDTDLTNEIDDDRRRIPGTGLPVVEAIDFDRDLIFADFYIKIAAQAE